jgi:hypothetical protein
MEKFRFVSQAPVASLRAGTSIDAPAPVPVSWEQVEMMSAEFLDALARNGDDVTGPDRERFMTPKTVRDSCFGVEMGELTRWLL